MKPLINFFSQSIWAAACVFFGYYAAKTDGYPSFSANDALTASLTFILAYVISVVIIETVDWFRKKEVTE